MLDFPEDAATAVAHLKATLPLLTRQNLPPNPINYGIWYLYASKRSKELQRALDTLLVEPDGYNKSQAASLFRQFLLEDNSDENRKVSGRLHLLVQSVQGALHDTLHSTNTMDKQLSSSRELIRTACQSSDFEQAVEHLLKSIDQLSTSNRDYRRIVQGADDELDRLKAELTRLQRATDIDELTQLYNRAALLREIDRLISAADKKPFCLIMMDIDHFKSINDRFGHLMGDRVLQRIGSLLLENLRTDTLAARFGGEEFVILCRDTDLQNGSQLAERLREQMQRLRIKIRNSDTVLNSLSASFGIAAYRPGDSVDTLLERADHAMYEAKHSGRNATRQEPSETASTQ